MTDLEKRLLIKKVIYLILILIGISAALVTIVLLFTARSDFQAWIDALFFNGFLIFAFSWMMIISNENLFSVAIYGVRQFLSNLLGKKPKNTLLEYIESRKQIDRYIIVTTMIYGSFFIALAVILYYSFS